MKYEFCTDLDSKFGGNCTTLVREGDLTVKELFSGLKEYFEFYNFERSHQSLSGKTPAEIYWGRDVVKKAT